MTKIILNDGTEEFLTPGAARKKVVAGEGKFKSYDSTEFSTKYKTREIVAEQPSEEEVKPKRKRRTKAEIEADEAAAESSDDEAE